MFAIIYLILVILVGDNLCRRFCKYVSTPHRFAAAFLVGLVVSTWTTYLGARIFAFSSRPLLFGNLLFFILAGGTIFLLSRARFAQRSKEQFPTRSIAENRKDWIITAVFFVVAWWMMFSSFNMQSGKLQIANHQWSDFGPNVALMQSFAFGRNFPTEYPHFAGDRIRYHFLFYFQAGNLEYLGLNPAWSNNLLSILSLVSMLVLVMVIGFLLFRSRAVGRIGAGLFFFHGSLAYIAFLRSQGSIGNAFKAVTGLNSFLPSGYPYRGEDWGMWSLVNFLNQRHFASGIGILLLMLTFLIIRYRSSLTSTIPMLPKTDASEKELELWNERPAKVGRSEQHWLKQTLMQNTHFIFFGALVGLLPMWNGAVFIAAVVALVAFLVLFQLRKQTLILFVTAAFVAFPQILYLKTGNVRESSHSLFHWGYTINDPTLTNVLKYLGYSFGFKWLFIALAFTWMSWFQRRMLIAITSLVAVAFLFQFSEEVLANHKFLNIWLIVANLFVAYGIWRLWHTTLKNNSLLLRLATVVLVVLVTLGGAIDLFPIHRAYWAEVNFEGDPLVRWTQQQTDPQAVFLSDRFVMHQILLAGRRVFFGWPYYTWGTGYRTDEREVIYRRLFQEQNPEQLLRLLTQNNISYVAIDDGLRRGDFIKNVNEAVYENHFEKVFQDSENRYGGLSIFKVPRSSGALSEMNSSIAETSASESTLPAVNAFAGGRGMARGQFASARGVAVDSEGNIYVADTGNSRIQKFLPNGEFLATIGRGGNGTSRLRDPVGVALDVEGNIYVSDSGSHKLVKFKSNGTFVTEWAGPPPAFYGPLDVAVGPQGYLYIVDQGRARVVVMDTAGNTITEWGKKGKVEGEFDDPTGISVGGDRVYVADLQNNRIQTFDLDGKFIRDWQVPEWHKQVFHNPDVMFDPQAKRVYVSSGATNQILVFDSDGKPLGQKLPAKPVTLNRPSGLALMEEEGMKRLFVMNTDGARLSWIELGKSEPKELHQASTATLKSRQ